MRKYVVLIIIIFILSCENKGKVFNGEIIEISPASEITLPTGTEVVLNDIHNGYMSVYDSLILFEDNGNHFLSVYSLNTGDLVCELCTKGRGPNEFLFFHHLEQFFVDNKNIKLWGYESPINKIYLLNLTLSIKENRTVIDSLFVFDWMYINPFLHFFSIDSSHFTIQNQNGYLKSNSYDYHFAAYHLFENTLENEFERFELYNRMPYRITDYNKTAHFYSNDRINPRKNKIAMGMMYLSQINIIDIPTGKTKGYRIKKSPDFDDLPEKRIFSYMDICVDDFLIIGLFANPELNSSIQNFLSNTIHLFDWDGNFLYQAKLDHIVNQIAFDPVEKNLYGYTEFGEIYKWPLLQFYSNFHDSCNH